MKNEWWMEKFDEAVPLMEYRARDRTLSQLKYIFDGDEMGEALDDQAEEMRASQCAGMNHFRDNVLIPLISEIVAEAEERVRKAYRG
jgi:hypothetical protein